MAYGQVRRRGSFLAGRGVVVVAIVAIHALAIAGLSSVGVRQRFVDTSPPVEVVFLEEHAPVQTPAQTPPKLADVRPIDVALPEFDVPAETPAPTAITVSPPKVQQAAAPVAAPSDVPVMVDVVDFIRQPAFRYPPAAMQARIEGTVLLRVLVDRDGKPRECRVHRSSGSEQLDAAAREWIMLALFKPHRENGEARSAQVIVPIEYSLKHRTARRS
jgi:periplasmic protein TonB